MAPSPTAPKPQSSARRDVPWLAAVQPPLGSKQFADLLVAGDGSRITRPEQWAAKRNQLRRDWFEFIGVFAHNPPPLRVQVVREDRDAGVLRQLVRYENEPGMFVEAYILRPLGAAKPSSLPGFIVLHSTSDETIRLVAGLGSVQDEAFALRLVQRGAVAICPVCFLWPEGDKGNGEFDYYGATERALARGAANNPGRPAPKGMAKMIYDAQRAIDMLLKLPEVDPARLGCTGHSLGAMEAFYLAALDDRIKASAVHECAVQLHANNWESPWYLGPACREPSFKLDHHELIALMAPRPFLLIAGDGNDNDESQPYLAAARPVYELLDSPARLGFFNHHQGHVVVPEAQSKIEDWLWAYT